MLLAFQRCMGRLCSEQKVRTEIRRRSAQPCFQLKTCGVRARLNVTLPVHSRVAGPLGALQRSCGVQSRAHNARFGQCACGVPTRAQFCSVFKLIDFLAISSSAVPPTVRAPPAMPTAAHCATARILSPSLIGLHDAYYSRALLAVLAGCRHG